MYVVPDNQPDIPFECNFTALDEKGQPTTAFDVVVDTSDPTMAKILPDPGGDHKKGILHFEGVEGVFGVECQVEKHDGTIIGSFGAQFTVTAGDPASIQGGSITFQGISEAPAPAPGP